MTATDIMKAIALLDADELKAFEEGVKSKGDNALATAFLNLPYENQYGLSKTLLQDYGIDFNMSEQEPEREEVSNIEITTFKEKVTPKKAAAKKAAEKANK